MPEHYWERLQVCMELITHTVLIFLEQKKIIFQSFVFILFTSSVENIFQFQIYDMFLHTFRKTVTLNAACIDQCAL